jgi:hypothetical protein
MAGAEGIEWTLIPLEKTGDAIEGSDTPHLMTATGEHFVDVRLVSYVPDNPIVRSVEDRMKSDRHLGGSQARSKVPSGSTHSVDQLVAQFVGNLIKLVWLEAAEILR